MVSEQKQLANQAMANGSWCVYGADTLAAAMGILSAVLKWGGPQEPFWTGLFGLGGTSSIVLMTWLQAYQCHGTKPTLLPINGQSDDWWASMLTVMNALAMFHGYYSTTTIFGTWLGMEAGFIPVSFRRGSSVVAGTGYENAQG